MGYFQPDKASECLDSSVESRTISQIQSPNTLISVYSFENFLVLMPQTLKFTGLTQAEECTNIALFKIMCISGKSVTLQWTGLKQRQTKWTHTEYRQTLTHTQSCMQTDRGTDKCNELRLLMCCSLCLQQSSHCRTQYTVHTTPSLQGAMYKVRVLSMISSL